MPAIVTPNTAKIDADDEALDCPEIDHSGASGGPIGSTESDRQRRLSRCTHHGGPFRTRAAPTLAGSHGLCFPSFSIYRRGRFLSRICPLSGGPDHHGAGCGCNCFHSDVRMVRRNLVLACMEEELENLNHEDHATEGPPRAPRRFQKGVRKSGDASPSRARPAPAVPHDRSA
jgi:hypothetical protein